MKVFQTVIVKSPSPKVISNAGTTISLSEVKTLANMASANSNTSFDITDINSGHEYNMLLNTLSEPEFKLPDTVVLAGSFIIGEKYTIKTVGSTDFIAIGASANTIGVVFTATGLGTGTGDAYLNAKKILGDSFTASADTYVYIRNNSMRTEYYFKSI